LFSNCICTCFYGFGRGPGGSRSGVLVLGSAFDHGLQTDECNGSAAGAVPRAPAGETGTECGRGDGDGDGTGTGAGGDGNGDGYPDRLLQLLGLLLLLL